jgi:ComF family protein
LIKAFKYHEELHWLEPLATLLGQKIDDFYEQCPKPSALLAMPLHPKRIKERGFNQALELANRLARRYQTPLLKNACARLRDTRPQSTLSEKERKKNVSKAFSANAIPFSHIALIDDVVTTGCSISALSKQLKAQNPALRIDVWCLAKA